MSMIGNLVAITPQKLDELRASPDQVESFIYGEVADTDAHLDLDKAWHAIHFILNGSAWEGEGALGQAVLGGTELGEDVGYGPARYLIAEEVAQIASALESISTVEFRQRFDAPALTANEIYPQMWDQVDETLIGYVADHFHQMREFYRAAAGSGQAALVYIN